MFHERLQNRRNAIAMPDICGFFEMHLLLQIALFANGFSNDAPRRVSHGKQTGSSLPSSLNK